ncbi:MAG TPA: TonB family protein [Opitutaceae bacterium]|nr:TonB family protein [Opitutaceae bacterium]
MPIRWTGSGAGGAAHEVLSVLMGAAFTFCLLWGVAHYARVTPSHPPPAFDDLRAVTLPIQPPPPPRPVETETEPAIAAATVLDFAPGPSDSPVKIALTLPSLESLLPANPLALPALLQVGQLYGEFKPRTDVAPDAQRIFQQSEVDSIPTALYRPPPPLSRRQFKDTDRFRLTLLFVVEPNGAITNVRVAKSSQNPEVDAIVAETVQKEWGFAPAIKRGKKVRCLLQQPFTIVLPSASQFHM